MVHKKSVCSELLKYPDWGVSRLTVAGMGKTALLWHVMQFDRVPFGNVSSRNGLKQILGELFDSIGVVALRVMFIKKCRHLFPRTVEGRSSP